MPVLTKAQTDNKTAEELKSLLCVEFLSGAATEPGIAYKFYGVDSQPQVVSITDNMEAYLQITDNQAHRHRAVLPRKSERTQKVQKD